MAPVIDVSALGLQMNGSALIFQRCNGSDVLNARVGIVGLRAG